MDPTIVIIECQGPGALLVRARDAAGNQRGPVTIVAPKEQAKIELLPDGDGTIELEHTSAQ